MLKHWNKKGISRCMEATEMSEYTQEITFEQARRSVAERARRSWEPFMESLAVPVLSERYEEAECCWFFFRSEQIQGPPERPLAWNYAYAISKKGSIIAI